MDYNYLKSKGGKAFRRALGTRIRNFDECLIKLEYYALGANSNVLRPRKYKPRVPDEVKLMIYFLRKNKKVSFRDLADTYNICVSTAYRIFSDMRKIFCEKRTR